MTRPAVPMLTEREARLIGASAERLSTYRGLMQDIRAGTLTIQGKNGTHTLPLTTGDTACLLALLREREEVFLTGLNIALETASQ